jgi:hypothetical protein
MSCRENLDQAHNTQVGEVAAKARRQVKITCDVFRSALKVSVRIDIDVARYREMVSICQCVAMNQFYSYAFHLKSEVT